MTNGETIVALIVAIWLAATIGYLQGRRECRAERAPRLSDKARYRVLKDGWIRNPGEGCPVPPYTVIELQDDLDSYGPKYAREVPDEWWRGKATVYGRNIRFYRILSEAAE